MDEGRLVNCPPASFLGSFPVVCCARPTGPPGSCLARGARACSRALALHPDHFTVFKTVTPPWARPATVHALVPIVAICATAASRPEASSPGVSWGRRVPRVTRSAPHLGAPTRRMGLKNASNFTIRCARSRCCALAKACGQRGQIPPGAIASTLARAMTRSFNIYTCSL